jgi:hypothetical protein
MACNKGETIMPSTTLKSAGELQKKRGRYCCREYPKKCDRDDFASPQAENMHWLRAHSNSDAWKGRARDRVKSKAKQVISNRQQSELLGAMIDVLKQHPDGMSRADLIAELIARGVKNSPDSLGTYLAQVVRSNPEAGVTRPERGFYKLGGNKTWTQPKKGKGRKTAKHEPSDEAASEELILLRASNQRKGDAIMKLMEVVVMLTS